MESIFTKIVNGQIPSYKIAEDDKYFAFLDINPLAIGHTLVIPKKNTDYIFDVEDQEFVGLFLFTKKIAKAIKKAYPCEKVGISVIGLEVRHAHIHLVPLKGLYDMDFKNPKLSLTIQEFSEIAEKIASAIE